MTVTDRPTHRSAHRPTDHPAYCRTQTFSALWVILPVTAAVATGVLMALGEAGAARSVALLLAADALVLLLLGRLVVEVDAQALRWRHGFVGWPRGELPLADIERTEVTRFGTDIKGTRNDRMAFASMGGPALRLWLRGGGRITLGSPEPKRLQGFIDVRRPKPAPPGAAARA